MSTTLHQGTRSFLLKNAQRRNFSQKIGKDAHAASQSIASATASATTGANSTQKAQQQKSRLDRLLKRTPRFLQRHISSLRSAPITHVSAFLLLHEITAVVPLFGLAGAFHYYNWLPTYFSEGAWVVAGVEKFGRYFKRKGWISNIEEQEAERLAERGDAAEVERRKKFNGEKWWNRGEGGVRVVVEFATAYAIVKTLLIPRLMLSAWGAPWFARWTIIPLTNSIKKVFRRGKAT